ncbi:PRC-barrel domain-containing protein [Methanobacterium sp.]|uniref:PRC-barrel domain-containing protein n=1 Tax=Methanobacterium sp. TaxID=2164 RepID=UPI003C734B97
MKMSDELKGKEVVDDAGNKNGEISDVKRNPESNKVESLVITEGDPSAKMGLGDKKIVSFTNVDSVGDKVVLRGSLSR